MVTRVMLTFHCNCTFKKEDWVAEAIHVLQFMDFRGENKFLTNYYK